VLIDTQVLVWYTNRNPRLSPRSINVIRTPGNHYSIASVWEAAIKSGLGKLDLTHGTMRVSALEFFTSIADRLQLTPLPITAAAAAAVEFLPPHHRDPFDRLLIAQALERNLELISSDAIFDRYGVRRVW
jgi:PIN domain nuclease of toxin-antitoxin system